MALAWAAAVADGAVGVAVVSSIAAIPRALLMLPGGAIADRFGLRRIMLGSTVVRMTVVAIAGLVMLAGPNVAVLVATALVFGIADAMFMPAASAIPARLVSADRLQRANSLITFIRRVALLIGAPLGGLLVAGPGVGPAFLFEAATFAVSLGFLAVLRLRPLPDVADPRPARVSPAWWHTVRSGFTEGPASSGPHRCCAGWSSSAPLLNSASPAPYNAGLPLLAQYRGWGPREWGSCCQPSGSGRRWGR